MIIKILVATHKKYWMLQDSVYLPVQLGSAINKTLGYQRDDEGENISAKQPYYAELTAMYWAWKNLKADYIGINHYRRYFSKEKYHIFGEADKNKLFNYKDFEILLKKYPVILPKQRNYFIETRYAQYKHAHNIADLELCREIIKKLYPEYLNAFDSTINKTKGHILNMFVMRYDLYCKYCQWLFSILFKLEQEINLKNYIGYQQRVLGYIAERLLDVWIEHNRIPYIDADYVTLEKIDWFTKIKNFLKRKIAEQV